MKLTELEPRWWNLLQDDIHVGLTFLCPHCKTERLGIAFHHRGHEMIEDQYIKAHDGNNRFVWTMDGLEDFDCLTITPSIDASAFRHWHGFITNGEVKP
jgi:hypothetical protein